MLSCFSPSILSLQLFDLLGFDQFEFIQTLLKRRREVVGAILETPKGIAPAPITKPRDTPTKPTYGAQVIIQVSLLTGIKSLIHCRLGVFLVWAFSKLFTSNY